MTGTDLTPELVNLAAEIRRKKMIWEQSAGRISKKSILHRQMDSLKNSGLYIFALYPPRCKRRYRENLRIVPFHDQHGQAEWSTILELTQ